MTLLKSILILVSFGSFVVFAIPSQNVTTFSFPPEKSTNDGNKSSDVKFPQEVPIVADNGKDAPQEYESEEDVTGNATDVEGRGLFRRRRRPCCRRPHRYGGPGPGFGDINLVQPVALKPVGAPIAAVPVGSSGPYSYASQFHHGSTPGISPLGGYGYGHGHGHGIFPPRPLGFGGGIPLSGSALGLGLQRPLGFGIGHGFPLGVGGFHSGLSLGSAGWKSPEEKHVHHHKHNHEHPPSVTTYTSYPEHTVHVGHEEFPDYIHTPSEKTLISSLPPGAVSSGSGCTCIKIMECVSQRRSDMRDNDMAGNNYGSETWVIKSGESRSKVIFSDDGIHNQTNKEIESRQLNIDGDCPGGYVCCRKSRQSFSNVDHSSKYYDYASSHKYSDVPKKPSYIFNPNSIHYSPSKDKEPGHRVQFQSSLEHDNDGMRLREGLRDQLARHHRCGKMNEKLSSGRPAGISARELQHISARVISPDAGGSLTNSETEPWEYPWQVAILKKSKNDKTDLVYSCGGALIDSRHVITAAHCVKQHNYQDLTIRLGEWDILHEYESFPHIDRDIVSAQIHPDFYGGALYNDIAVLKLDREVDFERNPHISPICLPSYSSSSTNGGRRCIVSGWGKDRFEGGKYQRVLKKVNLSLMDNFECERRLQRTDLGSGFQLHQGFLCAGGEQGKDACKGDGGSPLICETSDRTWEMVGVVSWGVSCGQHGVPGVYVNVLKYMDFIKRATQT